MSRKFCENSHGDTTDDEDEGVTESITVVYTRAMLLSADKLDHELYEDKDENERDTKETDRTKDLLEVSLSLVSI